jgi:hypothetical protein
MKELAVKLTVDGGQSIKETQAIENNLKDIDKSVNDINDTPLTLDEKFKKINKEVESGGLSARELTKRIKEYQTIALQAGESSPIGKAAIGQAAALRDRLGDLNNAINATAHDGKNMQAALQLGSTITAGYQAFQGVTALVGVENEKLMETMVKLQGATAVLTSLEQIRASLEKESFLMIKAKAIQTNLLSIATAGYSAVVGTTTGAVKLFRLALVSTGIGAIIVGLGLLIANMDKVAAAFEWVGQKAIEAFDYFRSLGTGIKILLSIMFPFVGVIWAVTEALEALGVVETLEEKKARQVIEAKMKISTEAHKKRVDQIKEQIKFVKTQQEAEKSATDLAISNIDKEIELRRAAGEEVKDLEKAKLQILINSAQEQYRLAKTLLELQDAELLSRRQHNIDIQKDAGKNTAELEKALEFEKRQRALNIEENLATEKKALDDALHNLKVFNITMETERRNAQSKEVEDEVNHQNEIERIRNTKIANIEQANKTIETGQANHWIRMGQLAKEAADKQKKEDEEALARKLANIDAVDARATQGIDFLTNLNALFGKNSEKQAKREFQINKARDLAGAVTNTAKGVTQALASAPPPISFVNAGIVGAIGGLNIGRILSAQYGGSSTGAMSSSVAATNSAVITPQNNQGDDINNTSTNVNSLIGGGQSVLVVDSFTKVAAQQDKVQAVGTIG